MCTVTRDNLAEDDAILTLKLSLKAKMNLIELQVDASSVSSALVPSWPLK